MKAETKSLIAFLIIYLTSIALLFGIVGYLYFLTEKEQVVNKLQTKLHQKILHIKTLLEHDYLQRAQSVNIPSSGDDIAFYDADDEIVISSFDMPVNLKLPFSERNNIVTVVETVPIYYFGIKYIVMRTKIPTPYLDAILAKIYFVTAYGFIFIIFVAMLLSKILLQPLKNSVSLLNRFIKDTTHEMNTPITTILMSYEHMDKSGLNEKQLRSLNRMEIAAKNLSGLYDDLAFTAFNSYLAHQDEKVDMGYVVEERMHYFASWIAMKKMTVTSDLKHVTLKIDRKKIIRVIDNLLSNAIKYSRNGGTIELRLTDHFLSIKDNGVGIPETKQKDIFKRFIRASDADGGFGIGLDIVMQVCQEYGIQLKLKSKESEGSEFILIWPK